MLLCRDRLLSRQCGRPTTCTHLCALLPQSRPAGSPAVSRRSGRSGEQPGVAAAAAAAGGGGSTTNTDSLPAAAAAPVTDASVPEGHKSLHTFLYGDGDEHSASSREYEFVQGEDDGESILPLGPYLAAREGEERVLGVYALYDEARALQYVGYSRNIVRAVKAHLARVGEARAAFIRPMVFANKAMATRAAMERQVADWLDEAGTLPPGNGVEAALWDPAVAGADDAAAAAAADAAHHEKKLKMRKAMGDSLLDDVDVDAAAADRRLALLAAVSGDNWSSVVSDQTQATLMAAVAAGGGRLGGRQLGADAAQPHPQHVPVHTSSSGGSSTAAAAASGSGGGPSADGGTPIVSPFSKASVHRQVGEAHGSSSSSGGGGGAGSSAGGGGDGGGGAPAPAPPPPLTVEAVSQALDAVRPYLLADGGDVSVVGISPDGVVAVELQGACTSCASSSATLKMGIERQLKSVWGDAVSEVVQVNGGGGRPAASVEAINLHLNMLRSAVANLGGAVEAASVGGGVAVLRYRGPPAIGKGLSAAVRDAFPDVKEVVLQELPADE